MPILQGAEAPVYDFGVLCLEVGVAKCPPVTGLETIN
jgi:hypothetical protein